MEWRAPDAETTFWASFPIGCLHVFAFEMIAGGLESRPPANHRRDDVDPLRNLADDLDDGRAQFAEPD